MPAGDYYLNKFNGSSIDEKIFIAQVGKALSFDALLNPVMMSVASFSGMTAGYIVKYDGTTAVNSMLFETLSGVGIGELIPLAPLHVKAPNGITAIFANTGVGTVDRVFIGSGIIANEFGVYATNSTDEQNLICLHPDNSIGVGFNTLKVWVSEDSIALGTTLIPSAQLQINKAGCDSLRTALMIYVGNLLPTISSAIALSIKNAYDEEIFNVTADRNNSTTKVGNGIVGTHALTVNGIIDATGGNSTQWNTAYSHSQSSHSYVPYTGANANVNLGSYGLITSTLTGGIVQASLLNFIPTNYMTTLPSAIAYNFKGGNYGTTVLLSANHFGCFGFGIAPTTTAVLTIKAGTTGIAPLRLTSGTNLSTATAGSFEYDGTSLYFTPATTRYAVSLANHTHSYEPVLGNPAGNGYILSSTTLGARSWIAAPTTHNPVTIGTANGLSISVQALSMAAASTSVTGALTSTDWNTFNNKVSFPGFGTSHITAAYGDHTHSNYDNYNQWTFQPETALGAGTSYTISSGNFIRLIPGTGMDLSHSVTGSTVTVTLTSSGGFPGFGTTHTTAAYGDHTHSNYDNYNQWTFQAFNGFYDEISILSGNTLRFNTGPNIEFDTADLAVDGILVISVVNIPDIVLTGYAYGSIGLIAATDSLKVALSKLQTQMPKTLYYDVADYTNVGSGVNDISPYTLPANTLAYDGQRLELLYSGSSAANTNGKTIQFYFGGTSYITITNSNASSLNWFLRITIIRYSSTYFKLRFDGGWNISGYGTGFGMSINYAANNVIKLTAQGGATADIICKLVTITQFSI